MTIIRPAMQVSQECKDGFWLHTYCVIVSVGKSSSMERRKQTPNDYIFGKLIGEGSFSSVFLAREIATGRELAIKMCEKEHILKERKQGCNLSKSSLQ